MEETRRNSLKIIGAIGATCAYPFAADELFAQETPMHDHGGGPSYKPPVVGPFEPKFFTAAEGLAVVRVADLIIPPTDSPGAAQAGVPQYIDSVVNAEPKQQALFREGLRWLDSHGKPFVQMPEPDQIALLTPVSEAADAGKTDVPGAAFFLAFKKMTADGYYTSYAGLVQELGYKGNQALAKFEGCTHEH